MVVELDSKHVQKTLYMASFFPSWTLLFGQGRDSNELVAKAQDVSFFFFANT